MKRVALSLSFLFMVAAFGQPRMDEGSEFYVQQLTIRAALRTELIRGLEIIPQVERDSISTMPIDQQLEALTKTLLSARPEFPNRPFYWKQLRKSGYWKLVSAQLKDKSLTLGGDMKDAYIYRAKMKGIGFSTFYGALKISGFFVGLGAWATKNYPLIAALNSFSWNSSLATLLSAPAALWKMSSRAVRVRGVLRLMSLRSAFRQLRFQAGPPYVFFENDAISTANFLRGISLFRRPGEAFLRKLRAALADGSLDDREILRVFSHSEIEQDLKSVLLSYLLQKNHPEFYSKICEELKISSIFRYEKILVIEGMEEWARRLVEVSALSELKNLWEQTPDSLSTFEKADLWLNEVLPYLSKNKKTEIGLWDFRKIYSFVEKIYVSSYREARWPTGKSLDWVQQGGLYFNPPQKWSARIFQSGKSICRTLLLQRN